ncbi:YbaB/EbfC family nucleoid-associated protein [Thermomonospora catenispora]|uniref:YbaB/EbfC family nucleoid-associated protein n=1 Tax=Thermomonospora catenispora TaxID=2493090 RepID=UPI00111E0227|nr:YbaB/EbfC family nucleoid-associated protein [Thermomonospora catenispora]TNY36681.1 YbaB/EbfC family DNA-binding protein [Thermomonospora catenispora]
MAEFTSSEFDRMLSEARAALDAMRSRGSAPPDEEEVKGVGEAADGRVTATVNGSGLLESVELNPRVLRLPAEEIGEHIVTAVNAALQDFRTKASRATDAAPVDLNALAASMQELQDQSVRQMTQIGQAFNELLTRLDGLRR